MLFDLSESVIVAIVLVAFFLAIEAGYRLGMRRRYAGDQQAHAHVYALQGALLGLLALLLGFTFSMSVSRFDARKDLVLAEANAIGTAYLRAQLLEGMERKELSALLRAYVDARIAADNLDFDQLRAAESEAASLRLQEQLWSVAIVQAGRAPNAAVTHILAESLNEVIDLYARRQQAMQNRVPEVVLYLLFAVAGTALGFIGHACGLSGRRRFLSTAVVAVLIALVLAVILDLDRPHRGLIQVGQESMLKLKAGMK